MLSTNPLITTSMVHMESISTLPHDKCSELCVLYLHSDTHTLTHTHTHTHRLTLLPGPFPTLVWAGVSGTHTLNPDRWTHRAGQKGTGRLRAEPGVLNMRRS